MVIYIDGRQADADAGTSVAITLSVASMTRIDKTRTGYTRTITIPATRRNTLIMGDADQIHNPERFNDGEHTAWIEQEGCRVMTGVPMLIRSSLGQYGAGSYTVSIIGAGKKWIRYAAATSFRDIGIGFSETLTESVIVASWTWDKPVRFLPVQRDKFAVENTANDLFRPARILTMEDYHPFIHVRTALEAIFDAAGYSIESEFFAGEIFGQLYVSGNYPGKNTDILKARMDFRAGRFGDGSAVGDILGRVHANPYQDFCSIGNLVDTADPREVMDGVNIDGVYNNNGCFKKVDERVAFVPVSEVTLGFEYKLHYTTEYVMKSRAELTGFNRLYLDDGIYRSFVIANRNTDRRDEFRKDRSYTLVVFEHEGSSRYQFRYDEITNPAADPAGPGDYTTKTLKTFTDRTTEVTVYTDNTITNPRVFRAEGGSSVFTEYNGDWALYDGYVNDTGEVTVEVTVRSAPGRVLPSQPKFFDMVLFGGAKQGMRMTLHKTSTLRPVFGDYPSEGSVIDFSRIGANEMNCLDFINGIKHMFNLYFRTDELRKTVLIEPRNDFYRNDVVLDWTDRIDCSKPVTVSEPGIDMAGNLEFAYQDGDGAVSRRNISEGGKLGRWTVSIGNNFARETTEYHTNPVFTPSVNQAGDYPDAGSALLLQVGDRDNDTGERTESLYFPPKIVRYTGMVPLPEGERWGWPSSGTEYPFLAFHHGGDPDAESGADAYREGFTLCFEDRDGQPGLHRYYDKQIGYCTHGREVTVHLRLGPEDIENFIQPNRLCQDFRALYRLILDGEPGLYRLEEISGYDPSSGGTTKCVFVKEI